MKKIILVTVLGLIASNAMAMPRYDTQSMTCTTIQNKLAKDGSAVLSHPSTKVKGLMMYDLYVTNGSTCFGQGNMAGASVPASDNPNCKVKACAIAPTKGHNKHI
ncbi:MAG: hypothetical protein KGI75_08265 [Rhizobiaceae bacterium]|nr:hypothetical protein [Rhizobiaceae bacterium]